MKKGDKKDQKKLSTRKKVLIGIVIGLVILAVLGIVFYFVFRPDDGGSGGGGNPTKPPTKPPVTSPPPTEPPLNPAYCIVKQGQDIDRAVVTNMTPVANSGNPDDTILWLAFLEDLFGSLSNVELDDANEFDFRMTNDQILTDAELIACVEYAKVLKPDVIFAYQLAAGASIRFLRSFIYPSGVIPLSGDIQPLSFLTVVIPKTGTTPEYC